MIDHKKDTNETNSNTTTKDDTLVSRGSRRSVHFNDAILCDEYPWRLTEEQKASMYCTEKEYERMRNFTEKIANDDHKVLKTIGLETFHPIGYDMFEKNRIWTVVAVLREQALQARLTMKERSPEEVADRVAAVCRETTGNTVTDALVRAEACRRMVLKYASKSNSTSSNETHENKSSKHSTKKKKTKKKTTSRRKSKSPSLPSSSGRPLLAETTAEQASFITIDEENISMGGVPSPKGDDALPKAGSVASPKPPRRISRRLMSSPTIGSSNSNNRRKKYSSKRKSTTRQTGTEPTVV